MFYLFNSNLEFNTVAPLMSAIDLNNPIFIENIATSSLGAFNDIYSLTNESYFNYILDQYNFFLDFLGEKDRLNIKSLYYEILLEFNISWNFDYTFNFINNDLNSIVKIDYSIMLDKEFLYFNDLITNINPFFGTKENFFYSVYHQDVVNNIKAINTNLLYSWYGENFRNFFYNVDFIVKNELIGYLFSNDCCTVNTVINLNDDYSNMNTLKTLNNNFELNIYNLLLDSNLFTNINKDFNLNDDINLFSYDLNILNEFLGSYLDFYLFFFFLILIWFLLTIFFQIKMTRFNVNLSVLFIIFILIIYLNLNLSLSFNEFNFIFLNINFWTSMFVFIFLLCILLQYNIFYNNEPKNFEYVFFSISFLLISFFFFLINNLIDLLILLEIIALLGYFFVGLEKTRKVVSLIGIKYLIIGILSGIFIIQSFVFIYSEFSFLDIDNFNFIYLWNDFKLLNYFDFNKYIFNDLLQVKNYNFSFKDLINIIMIYDSSYINTLLNSLSSFFNNFNNSFTNCFNDLGYLSFEEDDLTLINSNIKFYNNLSLWEQFNIHFFKNMLPEHYYQHAFQKYTKENMFDDMLITCTFNENVCLTEKLNNFFIEDIIFYNNQHFFINDYSNLLLKDIFNLNSKNLIGDSFIYLYEDTMDLDVTFHPFMESKLNNIIDRMFILKTNNILIDSFYNNNYNFNNFYKIDNVLNTEILLLNNNVFINDLIKNLNNFNILQTIEISNLFSNNVIVLILFLLVFGLSFKIAAAPVHFWSLIIYQYAPIISAFFLNTFVKFIIFIIFFIVFFLLFFFNYNFYSILMFIIAFNCFLFGTTGAFVEKSIKRFFIFSSLSHTGFIILNLFLISSLSKVFFIIYLIYYILSSILLWSILFFDTSKQNIKTKRDLLYLPVFFKNDLLFIMFYSFNIISLSGLPPFSGFYIKYNILQNIIYNSNIGFFLIVFLLIISAFNIYYYLRIVKIICFETYSLNFDFKLIHKHFLRFLIFYLISFFFLIFFNIFFDDIYYILLSLI